MPRMTSRILKETEFTAFTRFRMTKFKRLCVFRGKRLPQKRNLMCSINLPNHHDTDVHDADPARLAVILSGLETIGRPLDEPAPEGVACTRHGLNSDKRQRERHAAHPSNLALVCDERRVRR